MDADAGEHERQQGEGLQNAKLRHSGRGLCLDDVGKRSYTGQGKIGIRLTDDAADRGRQARRIG